MQNSGTSGASAGAVYVAAVCFQADAGFWDLGATAVISTPGLGLLAFGSFLTVIASRQQRSLGHAVATWPLRVGFAAPILTVLIGVTRVVRTAL